MPRGGARINSGPPPDPNALRRDRKEDKGTWTILPADGRKGRTPAWPLLPDTRLSSMLDLAESQREIFEAQMEAGVAPRNTLAKIAKLDQQIAELRTRLRQAKKLEVELWKTLWRTPQAVMWEKLRWTREVALYTRLQVLAELGDLEAAKEARQWSDRLGLNPAAMMRNRWKVQDVTVAKPERSSRGPRSTSAKERLRVVQGGAQA